MWSRKYDKSFGWQAQRERELGAKFRKAKALTLNDLVQVVEWKFKEEPEKKQRALALVTRNNKAAVNRLSSQALSIPSCEDGYRMSCLTLLEGVSPMLASVILAFFDPKEYGVLDAASLERPAWQCSAQPAYNAELPETARGNQENSRKTKLGRKGNRQSALQKKPRRIQMT